jgi:hypothetical protein
MAIPVSALAKKKMPSLAVIKKSVFDPLGGQKDLAEKVLPTPLDYRLLSMQGPTQAALLQTKPQLDSQLSWKSHYS